MIYFHNTEHERKCFWPRLWQEMMKASFGSCTRRVAGSPPDDRSVPGPHSCLWWQFTTLSFLMKDYLMCQRSIHCTRYLVVVNNSMLRLRIVHNPHWHLQRWYSIDSWTIWCFASLLRDQCAEILRDLSVRGLFVMFDECLFRNRSRTRLCTSHHCNAPS